MKFFIIVALFSVAFAVKINPRIVGGENTERGAAPFMASVQVFRNQSGYQHTCGGAIVSTSFILTAAHCITDNTPLIQPMRIVAGEHNFTEYTGYEQIRAVNRMLLHPNFVRGEQPFDVGLLGTEAILVFVSGVVGSVNLPTLGSLPNGNARLFGWGSTSTGSNAVMPDVMQTVSKDILSFELCREVLRAQFPSAMPLHFTNICTGPLDSTVTACSGDFGGPIVQGGGSEPVS